ncbi:MAG: biopolymer transport protein ExbD [Saprospiraceae bacterium]|jgi:biopolymer transport protein ExbD|tara:strand:- start:1717 stop:2121 length:405 start_codon:yes stop_codon:yes gene_type:complete
MGIKKSSKVSAEFNMSSLTDIIFLLLIFFMLTSSLVTPNALNLQLPGKNKTADAPKTTGQAQVIKIERNGTYYYNGTKMSLSAVEKKARAYKRSKGKDAVITISPHSKASNDKVVAIMDIAYRFGILTVLTEPR